MTKFWAGDLYFYRLFYTDFLLCSHNGPILYNDNSFPSALLYSAINFHDYENVIYEHFEIAFLSFALSCLMFSIGFFVNITMNYKITTSNAGSVLAPKKNSPDLNSSVVYNNEDVNQYILREKSHDTF